MHFVIEYELCALLFLFIITCQYFFALRYPGKRNKLFGCILICAIADLLLDVIGIKTIEYAKTVPLWFNMVINYGYYLLQIMFPILFLLYILAITGRWGFSNRWIRLLFLPAGICVLILFSNPLTGAFFYFDDAMSYHRGNLLVLYYAESFFYLAVAVLIMRMHYLRLQKKQYKIISFFLLVIITAKLLQIMFPQYLLTNVSITIAFIMMHFTLQSPEEMQDMMTGAFSYSAFLLFLQHSLNERRVFQLVAIDLRGVRRINSLFGLAAGNQAISEAGRFLLAGKEKTWVFRMLGTRFVVITDSQEAYRSVLRRVEERFEQPWSIGGAQMMLYAHVSHISNTLLFSKPSDVINLIYVAFQEIPRSETASSTLEIDESLLNVIHRRLAVETAILQAVETGEGLQLYFQPIYSLEKGTFSFAEVLLRLFHPILGEISPAEFIPIAEKNGMAAKIDEWVIEESCRFVQQHRSKSLQGLKTLEINLSAAGILQQNFSDKLIDILTTYGIEPSFFLLEITETAATTAHDLLSDCMAGLQKQGFRFALDDFGSGYANIEQVMNLPFYAAKIDKTLLDTGEGGKNTAIFFEHTLRMFRRMGLITIVEGVENMEQAMRVGNLKADCIQGYCFAKPMPGKEFLNFLSEHDKKPVLPTGFPDFL